MNRTELIRQSKDKPNSLLYDPWYEAGVIKHEIGYTLKLNTNWVVNLELGLFKTISIDFNDYESLIDVLSQITNSVLVLKNGGSLPSGKSGEDSKEELIKNQETTGEGNTVCPSSSLHHPDHDSKMLKNKSGNLGTGGEKTENEKDGK